jgi:hypothetical protein
MTASPSPLALTDLDRRIWAEELEAFVPPRVFDVHTHVYRWDFNTDPNKQSTPMADLLGRTFLDSDRAALDACDAALLPGRRVERLSFGFPFWPSCDVEAANRFVAAQVGDGPSAALCWSSRA